MDLLEAPVSDDPILEARRAEIAALDLRIDSPPLFHEVR